MKAILILLGIIALDILVYIIFTPIIEFFMFYDFHIPRFENDDSTGRAVRRQRR